MWNNKQNSYTYIYGIDLLFTPERTITYTFSSLPCLFYQKNERILLRGEIQLIADSDLKKNVVLVSVRVYSYLLIQRINGA